MSRTNKSNSNAHTTINHITEKTPLCANPTTPAQSPCYIPLCLSSQSGHSHVLYYNVNAPTDEIFECATARMQAVINLMENLFEYNTAEKTAIPAVTKVSAYLLNDAMTLLQELNPIAMQLKAKPTN